MFFSNSWILIFIIFKWNSFFISFYTIFRSNILIHKISLLFFIIFFLYRLRFFLNFSSFISPIIITNFFRFECLLLLFNRTTNINRSTFISIFNISNTYFFIRLKYYIINMISFSFCSIIFFHWNSLYNSR